MKITALLVTTNVDCIGSAEIVKQMIILHA